MEQTVQEQPVLEEKSSQTGKSPQKKKRKVIKNWKSLLCYSLFMAWPVLQFCVFYIGVNFNSILLAFKEIDPTDYTKYTWTTKNLTSWFTDPTLWLQVKNAALVSVQAYLISLVIGVPAGLFFAYYIYKKMPLSSLFRVALFLPSILSSIVLVAIYTRFIDFVVPEVVENVFGYYMEETWLTNTSTRFGALMFYNVFISFGTSVLMYSNKMSSIDPEIIESAHLDGASGFREFFHIVLPMTFPTLSVFLITGVAGLFTNQINLFVFPEVIASDETRTLGYLLYYKTYKAGAFVNLYSEPAALGLILTCIAVPLTYLVKFLLEKFGPSEE